MVSEATYSGTASLRKQHFEVDLEDGKDRAGVELEEEPALQWVH
jgi:hypothetical protein